MLVRPNSALVEFLMAIERGLRLAALLCALAILASPLFGQSTADPSAGVRAGIPEDWSHHHLVFSPPATPDDLARVQQDPRYRQQPLRRNMMRTAGSFPDNSANDLDNSRLPPVRPRARSKIGRDWSMDLGTGKVGAAIFPAKYAFTTTGVGNCSGAAEPDYVVYNTGVAGSNGTTKQANIVAYDNIYSGCTGTVPSVYWSYYTGTGSAVTSAVLSEDGTKVAFMESPATGAAVLRILKFAAGEGTDYKAPAVPANLYTNTVAGNAANTPWSTCPTGKSCLISVAFQTEANPDTTSSPFYDYANDAIYVGDSKGYLHKFTGVFSGTPGEITGGGTNSGWPQLISASNPLASPVFDVNFKCGQTNCSGGTVFIGPTGSGGGPNFHSIAGVGGSANITTYNNLFNSGSTGSVDGPIVDPSAGMVYVFVNDDPGGNAGVWQLPETLISATEATVGTGSAAGSLYSGSLDNAYFTSTSSSSPTGHLWVCGNSGGNPGLYPVPINSNVMTTGAITVATTVAAVATPCSPVTEFCTNSGAACTATQGTDFIFASPQNEPATGQVAGCTASKGCVISYTVSGATATLKGAGGFTGGASGMIVDTQNTSVAGTLQLYFGILGSQACTGTGGTTGPGTGTGGCAVQASQTAP
ncbi:MAG TPA: hypothetical protein VK828_14275 [Terriglobales bacterium]|jgi:hypothetical protein|nr:hypothetical protein [Terriglobales bacterium]